LAPPTTSLVGLKSTTGVKPPPPGGEDRGSSFIRSNSLLFKKPANVNVS
jgi:hypothetical protein